MNARVYVDTVGWYVRPNNTDWRYNFQLQGLSAFVPSLVFHYPQGLRHTLGFNLNYVRKRGMARLGWGGGNDNPYIGKLDSAELRRSASRAVYAHWAIPANTGGVPVLWHNTIVDPNMQRASGVTLEELWQEVRFKRQAFEMAAAVLVSTFAERNRLSRQFPELAERFVYVPFFLPYLRSSSEEDIVAKHRASQVEVLFVGRDALRKGLDILLDALKMLEIEKRRGVRVSVVSSLRDGAIVVPRWMNLRFIAKADRPAVDDMMRRTHIYVMPSRFESYGFTFIEAMAQGAVPVVPNWEVQNEIVDCGNAGCVADPEPNSVATQIGRLLSDTDMRVRLALAAAARCRAEYFPDVVAQKFANAIRRCLAGC